MRSSSRATELQDHYRAKEGELARRFETMQEEWAEREKKSWEAHQTKLSESLAQGRTKLKEEQVKLDASYDAKELELAVRRAEDAHALDNERERLAREDEARTAELETQFSRRWAEREKVLQSEHHAQMERVRLDFGEQLAAERRSLEAQQKKRRICRPRRRRVNPVPARHE